MSGIYVLVCEHDGSENDGTALVFEHYIEDGKATLESINKFKSHLGNRYGKTRIAKLIFIDELQEGIDADA